jgi:oligopeptide transport system substrate-binding protein
VTSDEVVLGIRRGVDPAVASPAAALLRPIEHATEIIAGTMPPESLGVLATGPYTVVIKLSHATPYLPMLLARCVAFPVHQRSFRKFGNKFATQANLVSNGAYRLQAIAANTKISLVRNPYYWNASETAIDRIDHLPVSDAASQLLRYRANDVDMTSTLPAARLAWARQEVERELQVRPRLAVIYLAFNLRDGPLNGATKLREALSLAIDRDALTGSVLRAGEVPADSLVPPGIPGYIPASFAWRAEKKDDRLALAHRLYRESGFSSAHPLTLRLLHSEDEAFRNVALTAAAMWKEVLGVEVIQEQREFKTFLTERADRSKWDVLVSGWSADFQDPTNFLDVFRSNSATNEPGFADADYDRVLDTAETEARADVRLALLSSAERRFIDAYAVAPLYYPVLRRLVRPSVQGARLNPMGHNYSKSLTLPTKPKSVG